MIDFDRSAATPLDPPSSVAATSQVLYICIMKDASMDHCVSGKKMYSSLEVAEDVLIEAWTRFEYSTGQGPVAVYQCEDCGQFHLTSQGPMNEKLSKALSEGKIDRQKEADRWLNKIKRR